MDFQQVGVALVALVAIIVGLAQYVQSVLNRTGASREELMQDVEREHKLRLAAEANASLWEQRARKYYSVAKEWRNRAKRKARIADHMINHLAIISEKYDIDLNQIAEEAIDNNPPPIDEIDSKNP